MPTHVETTREFDREIERLGRKYSTVFIVAEFLIAQIETDARTGERVPGVGAVVYKARLPNPSARRGKRGGFRIVYYFHLPETVYLLTIYSKTEKDNISNAEIRWMVNSVR